MGDKKDEVYSDEEAKRRFEQALRGAKIAGHKPMKEISPKRGNKKKGKDDGDKR